MLRAVRVLAVGILVLGATALPAFAHAHLLGETPASDSSVAATTTLLLHFSESVEPAFTGAVLKDSAGSIVATEPTQIDAADPATVTVPISVRLTPGRYEVDWHAVAVDGHKTTGSYHFFVAP